MLLFIEKKGILGGGVTVDNTYQIIKYHEKTMCKDVYIFVRIYMYIYMYVCIYMCMYVCVLVHSEFLHLSKTIYVVIR